MKLILSTALLALSCACSLAARPEPQAQIDTFFKTLGDKGGSAAIAEICKGTLLEKQKASQIEAMSPQMDAALKVYGKVERVENVEEKAFGKSFVRFRLISYHSTGAPLFWEFMFFRSKADWEIYVFRFNDQFDQSFGNAR